MQRIAIIATQRTAIGQLNGQFATLSAPHLAAYAIEKVVAQAQISNEQIDEVILGCVLPAGQGQAPARQAAIYAKIPHGVGATTLNKMCGSGMKAMMVGANAIKAHGAQIILAGGMESMSRAPYLLLKARSGYRLGHSTLYDHMFLDGLEDAYEPGKLMGVFAEQCAQKFNLSREQQDEFAIHSLKRAQKAAKEGWFGPEIAPVTLVNKDTSEQFAQDELPLRAKLEKITQLKPAFKEDGTVTAANSSGISDGAAVHLLMSESVAQQHSVKPLAWIVGYVSHAQQPQWFTTAPIVAIQKLLKQVQWEIDKVDLFEINEAFAVVTLAAIKELNLPEEKVNIHGGACALGHPIGASGARIVTTLIYALKQKGLKRGVAAICIGGGEATAMAIELA